MNINDLARELGAERYGFATFAGVPQNSEITDTEAAFIRDAWTSNLFGEGTAEVEYTSGGKEIVHEYPSVLDAEERSPFDYI